MNTLNILIALCIIAALITSISIYKEYSKKKKKHKY